MGNLINTIKKFLSNKNTVTILGTIIGIFVLWGFYSYRVGEATKPIRIPYAKVTKQATEEITREDIDYVEINSKFLNKIQNVIRDENQIVGKYVATGTAIPAGGLFYYDEIVEKDDLPNTLFSDIEDGYTPYSLAVNNHTTFGNSIYPGDKIDLYLKANDDDGKVMYGMLVKSITVLGVRDGSGKNVFKLGNTATPAELIFSVEDDMYELLKKAEYVGLTIVPVPRNQNYTEENAQVETFEYLKNFILAKAAIIPTSTSN